MRFIFSLFGLVLAVAAWSIQVAAGPYQVDLRTEPTVIAVGKSTLIVTITANGQPVVGARVKGIAQMPSMAMGEREQTATPGEKPGEYRIPAVFAMAGGYEATIAISGPNGEATAKIPLETGQSTAPGASAPFPWGTAAIAVFVVLLIAFTGYRMRKTGQRVSLRGVFTRQVVVTLALFAVVVYGAVWAVERFRRPGAMTPIEGQVMDMSAPAPAGVTPVVLTTAKEQSFAPTVRYAGQAVGFVEQDVFPRVVGTIVEMPVYVGDTVHKGQVVARLDTSQLGPELAEKAALARGAASGAGSAQADYAQALAAVGEAKSQRVQAEGAVQESNANWTAANEAASAASAQVAAANADVEALRASVDSALADNEYWSRQVDRMKRLYDQGAISREEYERTRASGDRSAAAVQAAQQSVASAQARAKAATAELRQAQASVVAARNRVGQSKAELAQRRSQIKSAEAAAAAARQRADQASAETQAARASLQGAQATAGYAEIRAETDGLVTARMISPGVLVSPGQAILRIAQTRPIRLQANVAEADLAKIHVGASVSIHGQDAGGKPIRATVSSVAPMVDPKSRTGVVEVVLENRDQRFRPGQFVSMEIAVGPAQTRLVVPRSALQSEIEPSETDVISTSTRRFVWVAKPAGEGYSVEKKGVDVLGLAGDWAAISGGIDAGDQVVVAPPAELRAGDTVSAPKSGAPTGKTATIEVTEAGFVPARITIPAGRPVSLTFIRRTEATCATDVQFPTLGLKRDLPLNKPVTLELPPQKAGELRFACGMDMIKGSVVAR